MDNAAGLKKARATGICLHRPDGKGTCGTTLRKGRCRKHGADIYTALPEFKPKAKDE